MRRIATILTVIGLSMTTSAFAQEEAAKEMKAEETKSEVKLSEEQKMGYAVGMQIGEQLKGSLPDNLNLKGLMMGIEDSLKGEDMQLSMEEAGAMLMQLQQQEMARMQKAAEENKQAGQELLAENLEKEGVKETESGLQYKVLEKGKGESPTKKDLVTIHYTGQLPDGTVFDSSYEKGQPVTMTAGDFVPGFSEGLTMMKPGSKYKFWIPGELAYGQRGNPRAGIDPNQTLVFEVELLEVKEPQQQGMQGMQGMQMPQGHPQIQ